MSAFSVRPCSTFWRYGKASRAKRPSWPPGAPPRRTSSTFKRAQWSFEKQIAANRIYSRSNVQFHLAIARASHNNVLRESLGHLLGQLREFRERTVREIPQMSERDVIEHRAIVEAIRRRRPAAARRAAVEHIKRYAAIVKELRDPPSGTAMLQCGGGLRARVNSLIPR